MVDPGFLREGGALNSKSDKPTYYLVKFFSENCMKIKYLDREGALRTARIRQSKFKLINVSAPIYFCISLFFRLTRPDKETFVWNMELEE